jgi:thiamine-phosphate pyrophosphorylase
LYGITPEALPADWIVTAAQTAFAAGLRTLQLRSKHITGAARLALAQRLLSAAHAQGAQLIINDDCTLAAQVAAHGLHLGSSDGDIGAARAVLGDAAIIGASCYNSIDLARAAVAQGASYVAFGALFPSRTKPHAPPADLAVFAHAAALGLPSVGIGGITVANAARVIAAGASAVAVVSELFPAQGQHSPVSYAALVQRNTVDFLTALK